VSAAPVTPVPPGTTAAAVEEQSASTAQAQDAIGGASREATRMATDLQHIVTRM
jgi:hypothetical protein